MNKVERFPRQPPEGVGNRPPPPTKFDWKPMIGAEVNRDQLREALAIWDGSTELVTPENEWIIHDAARLLLDGPLSDILELRGECAGVTRGWWKVESRDDWTTWSDATWESMYESRGPMTSTTCTPHARSTTRVLGHATYWSA